LNITGGNSKSSGSGDLAAAATAAGADNNTVDASSSNTSSTSSPHSSLGSAHAPPQLSKVTAFEFMQAWNGLKGSTDIEQYVNVLDQIQPSDISKGTFIHY